MPRPLRLTRPRHGEEGDDGSARRQQIVILARLRQGRGRRNLVGIIRRMQDPREPVARQTFGPELRQHRLQRIVIVGGAQPLELAESAVEHELGVPLVDVAFALLDLGGGLPGIQARRRELQRGPFHRDPDAVADAVLPVERLLGDAESFLVEGLHRQLARRSPLLELPDLAAVVAQAGEDVPRRRRGPSLPPGTGSAALPRRESSSFAGGGSDRSTPSATR